jgi:hypothetical protein
MSSLVDPWITCGRCGRCGRGVRGANFGAMAAMAFVAPVAPVAPLREGLFLPGHKLRPTSQTLGPDSNTCLLISCENKLNN